MNIPLHMRQVVPNQAIHHVNGEMVEGREANT